MLNFLCSKITPKMLKVFIIEDEIPAQMNLKRAIALNFDDLEVVGQADSVADSVRWLGNPANCADIIFMDVELSDGTCFDIFKQIVIDSYIIITTAYDSYALKAIKVHSVDYLLKPIDAAELVAAVSRCRDLVRTRQDTVHDDAFDGTASRPMKEYKKRFAVKIGDRIVIIKAEDTAYVYSEEKCTYIVTHDAKRYILDMSLDTVEGMLDPGNFFRVTRSYIISLGSIRSISKYPNSRLKITLQPASEEAIFVSRMRASDFMKWIDGE